MTVWILTYYAEPDFPFRGGFVLHGIYKSFRTAESNKESLMRKLKGHAKNFVIERHKVHE